MNADVLNLVLAECVGAVLVGAIVGASVTWTRTRALAALACAAVAVVCAVGAQLTAGQTLWGFGAAQLVIASATLASTAVGACCRLSFDDALDAIGCSVLVALLGLFGVLLAGPLAAEAPARLINTALFTNPIVATASALNLDILRTEVLYRLSPIAHRTFDYPAWPEATMAFGFAAMIGFGAAASRRAELRT